MMQYYFWIFFNLLFIIGTAIYIWLFSTHNSTIIVYGQLLSQVAIILFLLNVNMYFVFLLIKKLKSRNIKIQLAKLSRKMMKLHIPIALAGTLLILIHAGIMFLQMTPLIGGLHPKILTGFTALLLLGITLFAGYLRHYRASGFRRKFHLVMAFCFAILFTIHLFIPIF